MRVDITLGVARPAAAKWRGIRPPSEPDRMARGYASKRAFKTFTIHSSRFSDTKMLFPIDTDCVCVGSCRAALLGEAFRGWTTLAARGWDPVNRSSAIAAVIVV